MVSLISRVEELKRIEEKTEKEYRKLLKKLKDPEYADLRNLILRLAIDTAFHKHLMEALKKAYEDAIKLVAEYGPEEGEEAVALIPGVPTIAMPLGFGQIGARVPPEEIVEVFLRDFPAEVVIPDDEKILDLIKRYLEDEERMERLYDDISKRAFHPIVRTLAQEIKRNEEQHLALLKGLEKKYSE
ncbi:hypothetical protein [Thermococcus sp.]|uniref:hypothetical protein n=1 Tax=Thermococcus sp. TaxID=35749 RepID=UPI00262AFA02|nr:hypothetical protein [Thermococcus sp.]